MRGVGALRCYAGVAERGNRLEDESVAWSIMSHGGSGACGAMTEPQSQRHGELNRTHD